MTSNTTTSNTTTHIKTNQEEEYLSLLANNCILIMNNPSSNINLVHHIISSTPPQYTKFMMLSLLKVFKGIIPLYKIRTLKDKVKQKKDTLCISKEDKELLKAYGEYINVLCKDTTRVSVKCSVEILEHFDHFNFTDKIVNKILINTNINNSRRDDQSTITTRRDDQSTITTRRDDQSTTLHQSQPHKASSTSDLCINVLEKKLKGLNGEIIFLIINQMYEVEYDSRILGLLVDIGFLDEYIKKEEKDGTTTTSQYNHQSNKYTDQSNKYNHQSSSNKVEDIFKKKRTVKKNLRRMEKERRSFENKNRKEEEEEEKQEEYVLHKKIADGLQRIYFKILKEVTDDTSSKIGNHLGGVLLGLQKYRKLIRKEFLEGLYVLLNDSLKTTVKYKLECIKTILIFYSSTGFDFLRLVNALFDIVSPFYRVEDWRGEYNKLVDCIDLLFIRLRQPIDRVYEIIDKINLHCSSRGGNKKLKEKVLEICAVYDLEKEAFYSYHLTKKFL